MIQENQNIEHKRIWKDEYLKWVSGFANAHGGKIYIGIDDDMTVGGVKKLHKQLEELPNKIINNTGVFPETNHLVIEGKDVIEIVIQPCGMPISYRGVYYYRSGATKQEFRGSALHEFLLRKLGFNWEDIPCEGSSLDDIDENAIEYFIDHAVSQGRMDPESQKSSKAEVLSNLGLLRDGVPSNGAILLFGKHPQRRFVTSGFKIGRFGADDSDLLIQDQVEGNLIQMADKIIKLLSSKYLIRPIHYEGLHRKEPLEIPEEALREMIFNSIIHKLQYGTWNQMSIYDDHIRLWNEGMLPDDFSIDTLMTKHTSKPRNPKMAQVFYRAGFIEAWGRGYEKIMKAFDNAHLKRPDFMVEQGGVTAIIPREVFLAIRGEGKTSQTDLNRPKADLKPTQNEPNSKNAITKTEQKNLIINLICKNPEISRYEIADKLGLHESSVKRRLESLVKEGRLRHIGPSNGGSWEIVD